MVYDINTRMFLPLEFDINTRGAVATECVLDRLSYRSVRPKPEGAPPTCLCPPLASRAAAAARGEL
jgi:hypothetical protein